MTDRREVADPPQMRDLTLRQLQIFWAVVHTGSLTRAAKQLAMRQPSISQQLSKMEHTLGGKLIRFVNNEMRLTPAGEFLLEETGRILGAVDRATTGITEFFEGRRGRLVVGTLPSLARNLIIPTLSRLMAEKSRYFLDIVELMPAEAIEQLHGRLADLAVISGYAVAARSGSGLHAVPLIEDAQLLAVPRTLPDLSSVGHPEQELEAGHLRVLNSTIRYAFGSEHSGRLDTWYARLLPSSSRGARCRSFESALAFVESGLGAAIVPELACRRGDKLLFDVTLYALPIPRRQTVVIMPDHYKALPGLRAFLDALKETAASIEPLDVRAAPPFVLSRLAPDTAETVGPRLATEREGLPDRGR
jgi:DNA-binding transcriptional LysR family regulator